MSLVNNLKKDLEDLDKRFNKKDRDFGKLAIDKTKVIERIMNKGGENGGRCIEIASGSLTEKELNVRRNLKLIKNGTGMSITNYIPY